MYRIVPGFLLLLLAGPALQAEDKPKDKPSPPAEQYKALDAEYQAAQQEFQKAMREVKTQEERQKVFQEKYPKPDKFAPRFLELAEKNPKDPAAVDALVWVVSHTSPFGAAKDSPRTRALEVLLRDHIGSEKLASLCRQMGSGMDKETETFLRTVLEKNTNREVQGQACLALAQYLKGRAASVRRLKDHPEMSKPYETMLGKEYLQELLAQDPKKADKEIEELFERVANKYADVKLVGRGALGDVAKRELFEIRNLAIGKTAPDIEGEDLDGKNFKLSDYRGKVVMLDFWGHW